ncbi:zinc-ribbon and DUF3426 domain-containing protein [Limnohabitans sp. yimb22184]|uniref:zinc-ribbon and DUF3426 domain-containing protein n=1 Tax=Limnohabitans sp. YIMB22184 TaxID=3374104 RepID=UPI003A8B3622
MSWIIRCPACSTTYKVVPDQLKIAQGWLRCGQCQQAFDSAGLVVDWPDVHPDALDLALQPAGQRVRIDDFLKQEDRSPSAPVMTAVAAFEEALTTFKPQSVSPLQDEAQADAAQGLVQADARAGKHPPRSWLTGVAGVLLLLALGLQWLWIERHVLSSIDPVVGSGLNAACRMVGCEILPLQIRDGVLIESSSLTPYDGGLRLSWSVRNVTDHALQTPSLELTLLDTQDKALVRRVLSATQQGAPSFLTPGQTWDGQLHLLLQADLVPSGYRLFSFYP